MAVSVTNHGFVLLALHVLRFLSVFGQGYTCQCQQQDSCAYCQPSGACTERNIALGKSANISSLYNNGQTEKSGPACLAVDGNTDTEFQEIQSSTSNPNCVHTANSDYFPFWEVDLGRMFVISKITIYGRHETTRNTLRNAQVQVEETLCYSFPSTYTHTDPLVINITSNLPLSGRRVRVYKVNDTDLIFFSVCEVQVWINCADNGFYGSSCLQCGNCKGTYCNASTGDCPNGCESGWKGNRCLTHCEPGEYGPNCLYKCAKCENTDSCDRFSGACPSGCQPGYQSQYCNQSCSAGSFGDGCSETCGQCKIISCNTSTGYCPGGCDSGWHGNKCDASCPNGTYGENCSNTCGWCSNSMPCERSTGLCESCQANYVPPLCTDCIRGKYGKNCNQSCTNCDGDGSCDIKFGNCTYGCSAGWKSDNCSLACQEGTYGKYCADSCGYCLQNATCRHTDGRCEKGCAGSYADDFCKSPVYPRSGDKTGIIAGVLSTVAIVLIISVIIVTFLIVRRRRLKGNIRGSKNQHFTSQAIQEGEGRLSFSPKTASLTASENKIVHHHAEPTKYKPSVAVKPTILKMPKRENICASSTSEHLYANATRPNVSSQLARDSTGSLEHLSDLEDEIDPTYRNEESVYATFISSRPQLDNVQRLLVNKLASGELPDQFQTLPKGLTDEHKAAKDAKNVKKNRYCSVLPYDKNRVVLADGFSEGGATDFINASYITGFHYDKAYIAAQGPRDNTAGDFWRMVWQEESTQIIMLTGLIEAGKNKCFEYWPATERSETYGPITVTGVDVQRRADFFVRSFVIKMRDNDDTRKVEQYHYLSWPDHGVPTTTSLVNFWRFAKAHSPRGPPPPVVVRCTAGVGRTGTYIGLDIAYQHALTGGEVNVHKIVERMRKERCIMVQAEEQYVFLHKALLEAFTGRDTAIPSKQFDKIFDQQIQVEKDNLCIDREFQTVMQMRLLASDASVATATRNIVTKPSNNEALPVDEHSAITGRDHFTNPVFLSAYKKQQGIILAPLPQECTLLDFWRLVDVSDVRTIVSLGYENEIEAAQDHCQYWPKDGGRNIKVGNYVIKHRITLSLGSSLVSYLMNFEKAGSSSHEVQVLRYRDWAGELPGNTSELLQLVDLLESLPLEGKKATPFIIQCLDGGSKSGLFGALYNVISRLMSDKEVDVYMAVREVHSVQREAITSVVHYRYCYHVAQHRLLETNLYANV